MHQASRWSLCALFFPAVWACGEAHEATTSVAAPEQVLRQVVDPQRTLALTEDLRLGDEEATALYWVRAVEVDAAGNIYVLERGNQRVSVFDARGNPLRRIGGEGEGPGEFIGAFSMTLRRDTLVVGDRRNRIHVFLSGGTHVRTRMHAALGTQDDGWQLGDAVTGTPEGWLVPAISYFRRDEEGSETKLPPLLRVRLYRMDSGGDLEESGFYWAHEGIGEWMGMFWVQPPYALRPTWGMDGLGRVLVADGDDYVIDVYRADGTPVLRIHNEVDRRPVTRAMLRDFEDALCRGGPECSSDQNRRKMAMSTLEHLQEVDAIRGFASGHFAVRRAYTDPDPWDRIIAGDWDLFAPGGKYLGRLPVDGTPWWFDGKSLLLTVRDELDVQHLVRYRVSPGTSPSD